jgi:hypothetical protein
MYDCNDSQSTSIDIRLVCCTLTFILARPDQRSWLVQERSSLARMADDASGA